MVRGICKIGVRRNDKEKEDRRGASLTRRVREKDDFKKFIAIALVDVTACEGSLGILIGGGYTFLVF